MLYCLLFIKGCDIINECEYGYIDCANQNIKCSTCFVNGQNYKTTKIKTYKLNKKRSKQDKRMGSEFEYKNHKNNVNILKNDIVSSMTLNSGATVLEKGDEQISGIINVMEELKTQMPDRAKGTKTFTIKRQWLDKLNKEAKMENKEFWYLKFSFNEDEANHSSSNIFVITEQDIIMSMIKTMVEDRKIAKNANAKIELANKRAAFIEAENIKLKAEINLLKAQIKYNKENNFV